MSTVEAHDHRVRVAALSDDSPPAQPRAAGHVVPADELYAVRRLTSTPAFTLAWAASLPVAGGGLVWYAALHCFVC